MVEQTRYDLVVAGAGVQGAAVALEAVRRGYRVLLLEQNAAAGMATSSRSSKLIHGGLRYLESLQFSLVRECLRDRARLLKHYPDLVSLQCFYIPVYQTTRRPALLIRTGLFLYSLLGGFQPANRFRSLPADEWGGLDGLETSGLRAVFQYYDAQTDDRLLTGRLVQEAAAGGAEVRFNALFTGCCAADDHAMVSFREAAVTHTVSTRYLVNAGGPWVNHILSRCSPVHEVFEIDLVQGTHIELPGVLEHGVYYLESPTDGRAVFAMPWRGHTLLGTTETLYTGDPALATPTQTEVEYLLAIYNHYFKDRCDAGQVLDKWAGLRVLPRSKASPFHRSRETVFHPNDRINPRIYSIYGGKLTSHHSMAIKLLRRLGPRHRQADTTSDAR